MIKMKMKSNKVIISAQNRLFEENVDLTPKYKTKE